MTMTQLDERLGETSVLPAARRRLHELLGQRFVRTIGVTVIVIAVVAIIAGLVSHSPDVVWQAIITGLLNGGVYSLIAMGLTLAYGVLHIINFANGSMLTLGLYLAYVAVHDWGMQPYVALLFVIPAMMAFGALTQKFLLNPVMNGASHNQLLVTIGLAVGLENLILLIAGPNPVSVTLPHGGSFSLFGATVDLGRLYAFVGAIAMVVLLSLILQKTPVGTAVRAVAANPVGASLVGVNIKNIYVLTFAIGGAAIGAAATLIAPFQSITPTTGDVFNLTAFVVVVLGGMGNVAGALVGGFVVGLTEQLAGIIFPEQSPLLSVFVVFLIVLFIRPRGVFGRAS
ncbi:MAG TPA: branched-chain amino acid ABC transporter permease [Gryllotalpicola sp.]